MMGSAFSRNRVSHASHRPSCAVPVIPTVRVRWLPHFGQPVVAVTSNECEQDPFRCCAEESGPVRWLHGLACAMAGHGITKTCDGNVTRRADG
jgi:hypothetical protein